MKVKKSDAVDKVWVLYWGGGGGCDGRKGANYVLAPLYNLEN